MSRLNVLNPEQANGVVKSLYDVITHAIGGAPDIHRRLANSPAALEGLLAVEQALRVHQTPIDFPAAPAI